MINLIEKWKNRETKKKLREENMKLKEMLLPQWKEPYLKGLRLTKFEVISIMKETEYYIPINHIRYEICKELFEKIMPFIEIEKVGENRMDEHSKKDIWRGSVVIGELR